MIQFDQFELENGLRVIVHQDKTTPIVAVNTLYDVGARDEQSNKTGFAHLFEHLMFGGSKHISSFDESLQKVGGENNAFTSNDITNYYITLPKQNIETAFWLESDRMLELAFTEKSLEVQRNVVIEEYKQRYLNQPYGDVWLQLRPLAYKQHPYQWPTIGKEIAHIENAVMSDVKDFFYKHYRPNNAILSIAGDIKVEEVKTQVEKWFGTIPRGQEYARNLPKEPQQNEARKLSLERDVPSDAIYKVYKMCSRNHSDYHKLDLLSDILSQGRSSRLYEQLVKQRKLFTDINAYITGSFDEGLFVVSGNLVKGITMSEAENAIDEELKKLKTEVISDQELNKVKNKLEVITRFSEMNILDKSMNLAISELIESASLVNTELNKYFGISSTELMNTASNYFKEQHSSTLYYHSTQQ